MELAIPPEDELRLRKAVLGGECVAFVGAGLSVPPGKKWKLLVQDIAARCRVSCDEDMSLPCIVDKCIDADEQKCDEALRELLPRHVASTRPAVNYLLRLPFKALLTTNFDPYIYLQCRRERYPELYIYPDLPLVNSVKAKLYHLHGFFDSDDRNASIRSLVFGKRSFETAYRKSLLPGFLLNVFVYEKVLFVCFNPMDECISKLLDQSNLLRHEVVSSARSKVRQLPERFALWSKGKSASTEDVSEDAVNQMRSLQITPVIYDRTAEDYRGLEKLLSSWVAQADLADRPPLYRTGFDLCVTTPPEGLT
jgi:hypothetical protein